jgi:AcrR family transcriptional regulator
MSPRTYEQNLALQEDSKNKIIEAALLLFADYGYEGTSVRQIAQQAGIAQGLLYNYFASKEQLLVEIMERGMNYALKAFEAIPPNAAPLVQLEALIRQIFVELEKQAAFWRVFYSLRNLTSFNKILGAAIRERVLHLKDFFANLYLQAGLPQPELRAYALYATIEGMILQYLLLGAEYPLPEIVNEMVRLHCPSDH